MIAFQEDTSGSMYKSVICQQLRAEGEDGLSSDAQVLPKPAAVGKKKVCFSLTSEVHQILL